MVRRLECPACHTAVEGEFPFDFLALRPEEAIFARAFLLARGNLRELERTLGLSYTALRGRLDAVTERLNARAQPTGPDSRAGASPSSGEADRSSAKTESVLTALETGSITVEEALRALRRDAPQA